MQQLSLTLPLPPSVNNYWGFSGHKRFLTLKAREFKKEVAHIVSQQPIRFGSKRLAITLILHFKDKRKADLDNRCKSLFDALAQSCPGFMDDDSQIDEITIKRGEIIKGGLCLVKIVALD